jgi:uncharacterized protein YcaQ
MKLSWSRAAAWRAQRHHLVQRAPAGDMLAVATRLCGLHAQVLSSAELTLWARVEGLEAGTVQRALWEERTLVKTWAMRGTLHLLPASELSLWHAALRGNPRYRRPALWRRFGLTLDQLDRLAETIAAALHGRVMTRDELMREVKKRSKSAKFGATIGMSWGTVLKPAAFNGHLCFGPSVGPRVRFTRPDTWLTAPPALMDSPAAETEVTRRFLAAYGPATFHDLARWWGGGGVANARKWVASLGDEAALVDVEGTPAWMLAADARKACEASPPRSVRLLPAFDQYVVGASRHAHHLLPGEDLRIRVYRPQGWISPVLLVNGRMEGVWRHEVKGSRVEVRIESFRKQPAWVRSAAAEEAARLAAFLGGKLRTPVSW